MSRVHWIALATTGRVGGKTFTALLKFFGSVEVIFEMTADELKRVPGVGPVTAEAISKTNLQIIEQAWAQLAGYGIHVATWLDREDYPDCLLDCEDSPPAIFMRGAMCPADRRAIAIVGTRQPKPESIELAQRMGFEFAKRGWTVVSGLAIGIDTAAHQGALEAKGRTLAVLGAGLLRLYPPENARLADAIQRSGAVLSEVHPEVTVNGQSLIARNRITSGLSRAVIVVQSGEDSGSMSTARRAWQQGRAVFAVTGGDQGCESLLEMGAEALVPGEIDYDLLSARLDALPAHTPQ